MDNAVIIVAAGRGRRVGGTTPKQFLPIGGTCALRRTVDVFLALPEIGPICTVVHPDDADACAAAMAGVRDRRLMPPTSGGETRAQSVLRGLEALAALDPARVLIHDAARPFVPPCVIRRVLQALDLAEGAFAALPVVDALWSVDGEGRAVAPVPREGLWRAQTPQAFRFESILAAHRAHAGEAADDVAVARAAGLEVRVVEGSEASFKITTQADLERARAICADERGA